MSLTQLAAILLFSAAGFAAGAAEQTAVTRRVVEHHIAAMTKRDVDAVVSDYSTEAVLINPDRIYAGKTAIRKVIEQIAAGQSILRPPSQEVYKGEVAFLVWMLDAGGRGAQSAETLIVRHNKSWPRPSRCSEPHAAEKMRAALSVTECIEAGATLH